MLLHDLTTQYLVVSVHQQDCTAWEQQQSDMTVPLREMLSANGSCSWVVC